MALIEHTLFEHQRLLSLLKETLRKTRQRMRDQENKKRMGKEFNISDLVYPRLQVYRQQSIHRRQFHKLSRRFYGPFVILEHIGKVVYRLDLPLGSKIHPVFRISLLHACVGSTTTTMPLPKSFVDDHPVEEHEDTRTVSHKGKPMKQVLLKWKGRDTSEAT